MKLVLGVDPGLSGALCLYNPTNGDISIMDMPTHTVTTNGKKKRRLDLYSLGTMLDYRRNDIARAYIEAPTSRPGEGVTSAFTFGFCCGAVQSAVAANLIPMELIPPAKWKRDMGLNQDKDASRRKASMIAPKYHGLWERVKDDGRAESFLIAYYGAKLLKL